MFHGQKKNDERYHEINDCLKHHLNTHIERTCVVLQELCGDIYKSVEANGYDFPGEQSREKEVWEWLKERHNVSHKGRRTDMCRFLDRVSANVQTLALWPVDVFERTILGLYQDMLKGGKFVKLVIKHPDVADGDVGEASTNPKRVTMDERALRECAQNAVAISIVFVLTQITEQSLQS